MKLRVHRASDGRRWEVIDPETRYVYGRFATEYQAREVAADIERRYAKGPTAERNRKAVA